MGESTSVNTVVIGGGQAGLNVGYFLKKQGQDFIILDAHDRVGGAWRSRWDSLRLFTPSQFDGLTGMRFPAKNHHAPTKDEMADYLESYAERFELPVRCGAKVEKVRRNGVGYEVETANGTYLADNVIVASGAHHHPWTPPFASELDPGIVQMHSNDFKSRDQLADGPVLIVGAANSGADIAMDLVQTHEVILAGRHPGHVPFRIEHPVTRYLVHVVRFMGQHVLTYRTPIGRKVLPKLASQGNPLVRVKPKDLLEAGVERIHERVAGVQDGKPTLADGRVLDVRNVIWATGYRPNWSWIDLPSIEPDKDPDHHRGIIASEPGLYFVGLLFQLSATSDTITGVARDARHIAKQVRRAARAPSQNATVA